MVLKRKILTLLALALSVSFMLCGCESKPETEAESNVEMEAETTNDDSSEFVSENISTESTVLSECLSEGKVIGYVVESVDKAEQPENIYFFNDGKVTIIPGREFGLTMGDFAKMTDEEILQTYETVKETYAENYKTQMIGNSDIGSQISSLEGELEYTRERKEISLDGHFNAGVFNELAVIIEERYGESELMRLEEKLVELSDANDSDLSSVALEDFYSAEQIAVFNDYYDSMISEYTASIEELKEKLDPSACKGPFFELPFKFLVETDKSGNKVQCEALIYPTLVYHLEGEAPSKSYDSLEFVLGLTRQENIYDTTYNCIALKGSGSFMTREVMDIDTLDSENILVDMTSEEKNELFREEVTARYE